MTTQKILTAGELSEILNINENTLKKLTKENQIPGQNIKNRWYYNFEQIIACLQKLEGGVLC